MTVIITTSSIPKNATIRLEYINAVILIARRYTNHIRAKIYFFRVSKIEQQLDDIYYRELQDNDFDAKISKIQDALTDYQTWFEAACPTMVHDDIFNSDLRKMRWISSDNDGPGGCQKIAYMYIIKLAKLLAHLRAVAPTWNTEGTQGSEYGYTLPIIEEPNRAMKQLVNWPEVMPC
jgi:hypothetical protein